MRNTLEPKVELSLCLSFFTPSVSLPWYFLFLGLCVIISGGFTLFVHWRKDRKREERAQRWVEVMKASTFIYCPILYWINKRRQYGIEATIKIGPPQAVAKTDINIQMPDFLWEPEPP